MQTASPASPAQHRYDDETRRALQQAFRDGWKILKERQPHHSWETHNDLKHDLSERLMGLADEGVTDIERLLHHALDGLNADVPPAARAVKSSLVKAKRLTSRTRHPSKARRAERPGERHFP